jgi:hypothetical protein
MTDSLKTFDLIADLPPRYLRLVRVMMDGPVVPVEPGDALARYCPQDGRDWFEVHPPEDHIEYLRQLGQRGWGLLHVIAFRRGHGGKIYQRRYLMCDEDIRQVRLALNVPSRRAT